MKRRWLVPSHHNGAMSIRRVSRPKLLLPLVALATLSGCSGVNAVTVSATSETRPSVSGGDSEYCAVIGELGLAEENLDLSEDPEGALAAVERMADAAPPELADDFEAFLDRLRQLAEIDEDDGAAALEQIFALFTDQEFAAAAEAVESYTLEQCGVQLGASPGGTGSGAGGDPDAGTDDGFDEDFGFGALDLEDVEAIEEANEGAAWVDKLTTTVINSGRDVRVATSGDDLTDDEALAVCEAMLDGLSAIEPEVTIVVANGETDVASSAEGACELV